MNKYIIGLSMICMFFTGLNAQTEHEKKYFKEAFTDTVKDESVVIVRDFEEYQISKQKELDYRVNVVLRTQYKLKDFSAVEAFNTLSKSNGLKKIIITQIKPDGAIKEIYLYEDKEYDENKQKYDVRLNEGSDKLAVEGLEIGDIVDYRYEYSYSTTVYSTGFKKFDVGFEAMVKNYSIFRKLPEFTRFLQEKYPKLSTLYVLKMPGELKLLQKATNCNYKFIETKENNYKIYKCPVGFTKTYKSEYFSYSYVDLPVLKFCVVNKDNIKMKNLYAYQFLDESISDMDIADLGRSFYANKKFIPHYFYYVRSRPGSYNSFEDVSLNAFFGAFLKTFAKNNKNKLDVLNKFHDYITNDDEINEWQFGKMNFAVLLARFCDKIEQPYMMMACLHKYDGPWDKIVHPSEINWGIFIENGDSDLFISDSDRKSNIYEKEGSLSGTSVLLFNTQDKSEPERVIFPSIKYTANKLILNSDIKFKDSTKNFDYHFINTYTYTGSQKQNIDDLISYKFYPEGLSTNPLFWGVVSYRLYNDEMFTDSGSYLPEFRRINASYEAKIAEAANENFEEYLYSDYHFSELSLDSFKIIEGANYKDDDQSINKFKIEFNTDDVIEKTNSDLLVLNLGRLITEQMEISNFKNNERLTNIYITNQREIDWDITIEIPKGYKSVNLTDFNQKFENEAGIFNATVTEEGSHLKIKIEKIYKVNYLSKEKWNEMVTYLKQAVLFYEKKLLLEKA